MARRNVRRVPYKLDSGGIEDLAAPEIRAILSGADALIGHGGRTLLSKLLKGSRDKTVLALDLHHEPSYGFYRQLTIDEILHRVDWTIENDYLGIVYDFRLPVLDFTERGWSIQLETRSDQLLDGFDARLSVGPPYDLTDLRDRNRGMIFRLLEKIEASGRRDFIPLLEAWASIDYKKVRTRIAEVIRSLSAAN